MLGQHGDPTLLMCKFVLEDKAGARYVAMHSCNQEAEAGGSHIDSLLRVYKASLTNLVKSCVRAKKKTA